MDVKSKQQWSVEETRCLLALWASAEVQKKLEGASRTRPVFEAIRREMATAGYDRNVEQINNKLKKLRKEYRDQKKSLGRTGRHPHFHLLDSVLGDRPPACKQQTSAPALLAPTAGDQIPQSPADPGRVRTRTCTPVPPGAPPLSPRLSPSTRDNAAASRVPGKRKRGSSDYVDFMKEMLLVAEGREDRRRRVRQELEERRLRVVRDLESAAGRREAELIRTLNEFDRGVLDVLGKLVLAVGRARNRAPPIKD